MIELNCRSILSDFNASKFFVYLCLLIFSVVLSFRLDDWIVVNYFVVFTPLWFCEAVVGLGFLVGFMSFICRAPSRNDHEARNDFLAMIFCFIEHLVLVVFELLCCFKFEYNTLGDGKPISWLYVCTPLFVLCFLSMVISVWSIRHDKSFEFELLFSINVIQFVFICFKLDNALNWTWMIVFVPTWIMFSFCSVGALYSLTVAIFLSRAAHLLAPTRRTHLLSAVSHVLLSLPLLTFFILLSNKLEILTNPVEGHEDIPYLFVFIPLWISLFFSMITSFDSKPSNTWWFGMRKPFFAFVFSCFPCLQQYANISYRFGHDAVDSAITQPRPRHSLRSTAPMNPNISPSQSLSSEHTQMLRNDDTKLIPGRTTFLSTIENPD